MRKLKHASPISPPALPGLREKCRQSGDTPEAGGSLRLPGIPRPPQDFRVPPPALARPMVLQRLRESPTWEGH